MDDVRNQGKTQEQSIKKSATQPRTFLDKKSLKKGLTGVGIFILLMLIVWVIRRIDETLIHGFNVSGFYVPAASALLLFVIGMIFYKRVRKTDTLKYEFITVAAHRLRTPLSRLGWMIAGLRDEVTTESGKPLVDDAGKTTAELSNIANQLLNSAEAGEESLFYSYIFHEEDLGLIIHQMVSEYAIVARKKNIEILISVPPNLPKVYADRDRIREAFAAFLENAVLYTPQGGRIEIALVPEWNHLKVSIKDSGMGISSTELPYVFTKFFRTKGAVAFDADRAGLGLAIAKDIIERHGGQAGVLSLGKDQGSTFWFTVPVVK